VEPVVFLDRDNTLIANDGDLGDPSRVRLLDGVASGLKALHEAGYRLVVISNQGGVARGAFTEEDVDAVHQRIAGMVDTESSLERVIDRFYYCPYHPEGTVPDYRREHPWRKPKPGMLLQAAQDLDLDLARSWMIGDQERDVAAGRSAGCRTVLVTDRVAEDDGIRCTARAATFSEAVQIVLRDAPPRDSSGAAPTAGGERGPHSAAPPRASGDELTALRRSMLELAEEVRTERMRRAEFTPTKMTAVAAQLLVILSGLLGLLHVGDPDIFMNWMLGAVLLQLVTITLVLMDQRG
jgi:D,D-heptose 1,7-bisphosphate phosphatase